MTAGEGRAHRGTLQRAVAIKQTHDWLCLQKLHLWIWIKTGEIWLIIRWISGLGAEHHWPGPVRGESCGQLRGLHVQGLVLSCLKSLLLGWGLETHSCVLGVFNGLIYPPCFCSGASVWLHSNTRCSDVTKEEDEGQVCRTCSCVCVCPWIFNVYDE